MNKGRFQKYLERQNGFSEETNKFRNMEISLVRDTTDNNKIIEKIEKDHNFDKSIVKVVNELNSLLKKKYSGKYKFDFIIGDSKSKNIDDLKIKGPPYYSLKQKLYEVKDKFEKMKNELEKSKNKQYLQ